MGPGCEDGVQGGQGKGVDLMETCANYTDRNDLFFSSDERRWITRIHKLAEAHPEEVKIIRQPENNDGCIYARMPNSYLHIQRKRKLELTEEQRELRRQQMAALQNSQKRGAITGN